MSSPNNTVVLTEPIISAESLAPIYPSQYYYDQKCAYKFVLSRASNVVSLPATPRMELGTIIHALHHWSFLNRHGGVTLTQAEQKFDELVSACERRLSASPLSAHLVPLSSSCDVFIKRRHSAVRHALREPSVRRAGGSSSARQLSEEGVVSSDGLIKGSMDAVYFNGDLVDIIDRKSGDVIRDGVLRESYVMQLKLYAGLVHDVAGTMPRSLALIDGAFNRYEVDFTPDEVMALYSAAKEWLGAIKEEALMRPSSLASLANPRPSNCNNCQLRPNCRPYWEAIRQGGQGYPMDFAFTVETVEALPQSHIVRFGGYDRSLSFRVKQARLSAYKPTLDQLKKGDKIFIMSAAMGGRQLEVDSQTVILIDRR
jgi:hypothetical protein